MCLQHWQTAQVCGIHSGLAGSPAFLPSFFQVEQASMIPPSKKGLRTGRNLLGRFSDLWPRRRWNVDHLEHENMENLCATKQPWILSFDGPDLRIGNTDIYNILNNGQPGGQEAQTARLVGWDSKDFESLCEVSDTNYVTNDVAAEETSMTSGKVPVSQWHILNDDADSDFLLDLIPNCVVQVVTAHECRELIKEADDDGDKRISFSEFLDMMKGTSKKKDKGDKGAELSQLMSMTKGDSDFAEVWLREEGNCSRGYSRRDWSGEELNLLTFVVSLGFICQASKKRS